MLMLDPELQSTENTNKKTELNRRNLTQSLKLKQKNSPTHTALTVPTMTERISSGVTAAVELDRVQL